MQEKIAVIDLDSLIFSAAHPRKTFDVNHIPIRENGKFVYEEKTHEEMFETADKIMDSILTVTKATDYIAYVKGKGNFRYEFNADYKSDRAKASPTFWEPIKTHLIEKWGAIIVNGIEVDDAVNITRLKLPNTFICAIDSDQLGLESIHPHYNWRKDKWIEVTKQEADYKFWSDMICGTHNCTKGIPGKGSVYASKLLYIYRDDEKILRNAVFNAFIEHFGEYEGVYEFYRNYRSLKLLETSDTFEIALPIKFSKSEDPSWI